MNTLGMVGFFSFFTVFPVMLLCSFVSFLGPAQPYLIGAAITGWVLYGIRHHVHYRHRFGSAACQEDLALGVAEVQSFAARDAIQVEEYEDEGSSYYVLLEDGSVLFLSGQYLYDLEDEKKFPCAEFDVVRGPNSRTFLDIICRGAYFSASKVLKPFTKADFRRGKVPEDGQVLRVDWQELLS